MGLPMVRDSCVLGRRAGICGAFPKQCRGRTSQMARRVVPTHHCNVAKLCASLDGQLLI